MSHASSCEDCDCQERIRALEDACAEMRTLITNERDSLAESYQAGFVERTPEVDETLEQYRHALSSDAGKSLLAEMEKLKTCLETAQRQLDKVDEALPEWKGTGRGRIETIAKLKQERDAAITEIGNLGRQLGQAQQERDAAMDAAADLTERLFQEGKKLEAACAKMRTDLQMVYDADTLTGDAFLEKYRRTTVGLLYWLSPRIKQVLSSDAGEGWLSPQEADALKATVDAAISRGQQETKAALKAEQEAAQLLTLVRELVEWEDSKEVLAAFDLAWAHGQVVSTEFCNKAGAMWDRARKALEVSHD